MKKRSGWKWVATYKNVVNAKLGLEKQRKKSTIYKGWEVYKRVGRRIFLRDSWK